MPTAKTVHLVGIRALEHDDTEYNIRFFDENGDEVVTTGDDVVLTGYEIGTAAAVADTDTLTEALGKLEARIAALEV